MLNGQWWPNCTVLMNYLTPMNSPTLLIYPANCRVPVRRWAGAGGQDGGLVAVAADAWSAPAVGFMAGVAVDEQAAGVGSACGCVGS